MDTVYFITKTGTRAGKDLSYYVNRSKDDENEILAGPFKTKRQAEQEVGRIREFERANKKRFEIDPVESGISIRSYEDERAKNIARLKDIDEVAEAIIEEESKLDRLESVVQDLIVENEKPKAMQDELRVLATESKLEADELARRIAESRREIEIEKGRTRAALLALRIRYDALMRESQTNLRTNTDTLRDTLSRLENLEKHKREEDDEKRTKLLLEEEKKKVDKRTAELKKEYNKKRDETERLKMIKIYKLRFYENPLVNPVTKQEMDVKSYSFKEFAHNFGNPLTLTKSKRAKVISELKFQLRQSGLTEYGEIFKKEIPIVDAIRGKKDQIKHKISQEFNPVERKKLEQELLDRELLERIDSELTTAQKLKYLTNPEAKKIRQAVLKKFH